MKNLIVAAATLAASVAALPASAAPPVPASPPADTASPIIQVQGYRRDCYWTGTGWGYKYGGKVLVCKPHRPHGAGWYWYSSGGKAGWYHKKHGWHHKW